MKQIMDKTRRQLGELSAMARASEETEKNILRQATRLLADVQSKIDAARVSALTGGDSEKAAYQELVLERGRLNQVIARSEAALQKS